MDAPAASGQSAPWLLAALGIGVLVFLVLPIFIVVPMSFSASRFLSFPPPPGRCAGTPSISEARSGCSRRW